MSTINSAPLLRSSSHLAPAAFALPPCSSHIFAHFAHNFRTSEVSGTFRVVTARLGQSLNCGGCPGSSGKNTFDSH